MGKIGEALRTAREARQVSLGRAEKDTRIRLDYLEALEEGHYHNLPAPVYARAYLRSYALYLGLDPAALIAQFNAECGVEEPQGVQSESRAKGVGMVITPGPIIALVVVVVAVVAVFYLYQQYSLAVDTAGFSWGSDSSATATPTTQVVQLDTAPTASPASTSTATATPIPTIKVAVKAMQPCWALVTVDGVKVYTGTMKVGETQTWIGKDKITMRAGNPSQVELT
ncbi:MAG TPA: RodZ domain-containing protein, partial [Chloroflexota bacterium]|nr:RodZ domain-containing protein [Chloroflexota bacterium]